MGFFSSLAENFTGAFGKREDIGMQGSTKSMFAKLKFWCLVTIFFWILYNILYLFQCTKPDGGDGICLLSENNGNINTFTLDISNLSTGGECGVGNPYEITGQGVDWIDTGYVTNGKQLIVYVNGNYFPWGEKQTPKTFGYHVTNIQTEDGKIQEGLNITQDYKECEMNTDIKYSILDDLDTKIMYENQLNSYTSANSNNRNENRGKVLIDNNIQGDCIIGNNCKAGLINEQQTACVLKHGAGIYMKIGIDAPFSYHIKNYFVPDYDISCANGNNCTYLYKTSNAGETYNLIQVPYAIPPVIYKKGVNTNGFIWDIRDNVMKNLQILQDYDKETEYKFYTLVRVNDDACKGEDYQKINGACYHSEQKTMTHEEIKNANCPISSTENINLPNELCAPQSGKRIYIKPADTCYEDNTGKINLTFTSGVKTTKKDDFSYRLDGIHITWIQDFISVLFEPFFGSQNDKYEISDILESGYPKYDKTEGTITVCMSGGDKDVLYLSSNGGDWMVKTEKYAVHGLKIKDNYDVTKMLISDGMIINSDFKIPTTETMNAFYTKNNKCIVFAIKNEYKSKEKNKYQIIKGISDYTTEEIRSTTTTLVRFANIEDGLFVKIRNAIMSTSVYHIARIMVVVWFVFSFGVGFVNKEKMLSKVPLITSDWKRFLILLWCTNPDNYEFIDKYLWNGLIYGAQSFSAGILDAVSRVYGTSIVADEPMAFFDQVIASITSKEVFLKLGAVATSQGSFVLFFFLFPFFVNGIIDFVLAVIGPIVSLGFTMFNFSSIIMFMPLYALTSMFGGQNQDKFYAAMKALVSEFVHFAFSLGFFGACIGFIYHYFLEIINIKVCWTNYSEYSFFNLINIKLGDWRICPPGSALEAGVIERFKIIWNMVTATFTFTMVLSILGKFSIKISEQLANIFAGSGGALNLETVNEMFNSFKEIFSTVLGNINAKFDQNEAKKTGYKMSHKNYQDEDGYSNSTDDDKKGDKKDDKNFVKRSGVDNDEKLKENYGSNSNINEKTNVKESNDDIRDMNFNNNEQMKAKQDNDGGNEYNDPSINFEGINDNIKQKHLNVDTSNNLGRKSYAEKKNENNNLNARNESQNVYRGSGLQENQLGLQNNDVALKENDLGLQNNDMGLHDGIFGDEKNNNERQQIEKKLNENEIKEKEIEKKINSFNKQISELKKVNDNMADQNEIDQKSLAERTLEAIERQKRNADIKLKTLKNDDWSLKKKNK